MSETIEQSAPDGKYMVDSYGDWARVEGVPIVTAAAADLGAAPVAPWPRYGMTGAILHLAGRGDFLTLFLFDLPPAGQSAPLRHLYEEALFVVSGRGATVIEGADGRESRLEWTAGSLFAVPMNARHRHVNRSDREPCRLASVNDLRYLFNVFRNEAFIFANPAAFPERAGGTDFRHGALWETARPLELAATPVGSEGSIDVTLVRGSIGAALHEVAPGATRQGPHAEAGCFLFGVAGHVRLEGARLERDAAVDLRPGLVAASPPDTAYRLSNSGPQPARLLAVRMGSARYPLLRTKRNA